MREASGSRVDAQREMLGHDYAQLGAELARRWNLSPTPSWISIASSSILSSRSGQQVALSVVVFVLLFRLAVPVLSSFVSLNLALLLLIRQFMDQL